MGKPVPVFYGTRQYRLGPIAQAAAEAEARARQEHWRLLYVALTRAEDMLFIGGSLGKSSPVPGLDSWHAVIRTALEGLDAEVSDDLYWSGEILTYRSGDPGHIEPGPASVSLKPIGVLPDWVLQPPAPESQPPKPLAPSRVAEDDVTSPPIPKRAIAAAKRGKLLHALFERLPVVPPVRRLEAADTWLARQAPDLDDAARSEIALTALNIIEDPDFADLFGPDALAEAPVAAVVDSTVVAGKIDRLLIAPDRIQIIDFKTGLHVPPTPDKVAPYHLAQMAAYVAALARIFPDRRIEAALLFTEAARLMPLPSELLAIHNPMSAVH